MRGKAILLVAVAALLGPDSRAAGDPDDPCRGRIGDEEITRIGEWAAAVAAETRGREAVAEVGERSCAAINRAVRDLPPAGGTIVLLAGAYVCSEPVVIDRDNVHVVGAGSKKTLLKAKDGLPIPVVVIGSIRNTDHNQYGVPYPDRITRNVTLSGLTADGNYHTHPNPVAVECWDPATGRSKSCDGDATSIRNNGLTVRRAEGIRVKDFVARANYSGGIVTEKYCKNLLMEDFSGEDNFFDGFAGYETTGSVFRNCRLSNNHYSGISADIRFDDNRFEGCELRHNGDNGVFSNAVHGNRYENMTVEDNANNSYYFDGHRDEQKNVIPGFCNGNQIVGGSAAGGGRGGIYVNSSCRDFLVENLEMKQPGGNCLRLAPGSQLLVKGSRCNGQDANGAYESGKRP